MFEIMISIALGLALLLLAFGVFMLFVIGIRYLKTLNDEDDQNGEDGDEDDEDLCENIYREIVEIRKTLEDLRGS